MGMFDFKRTKLVIMGKGRICGEGQQGGGERESDGFHVDCFLDGRPIPSAEFKDKLILWKDFGMRDFAGREPDQASLLPRLDHRRGLRTPEIRRGVPGVRAATRRAARPQVQS